MKVLFFNYEYPPLGGGAANATANILAEFSKIPDLEVDLVTSSIDEKYHLDKVGENIFVHRLPIGKNSTNLHFQSQKDLLAYSWRAYFFSRKLLREKRYDLSHSFFSVPCGFISLLLRWQYGLPYVVSLRGSDVPGYSERFTAIYYFLSPIIRYIWGKAGAVVSNSEGLKDLALKTKADQKIEIIYNGIDVAHFCPKMELRPEKRFIITTGASRVTHRKGLNYLIEAVSKLVPQYPNILLKIMGEGNARKDFEALVDRLNIMNQVEFLGRIPREETAPFYQEASLFVLPSLNEGMSNALLEALGSGLPILATDTGGSKELVHEGENGFIIKMKDGADIAEKIKIFLDDQTKVSQMGLESRKIAEKMSWENVAREYYNLYGQVKSL